MPDSPDSILADAHEQMCAALARVRHPISAEMVDGAMDVLRVALVKQRRLIARRIRFEAGRAQRGVFPAGCRSVSYDAGMRRAAVVAEDVRSPLESVSAWLADGNGGDGS